MLHKLNPVRLAYIRDRIDAHWHVDARERHALAGRSAIDVGCGAGLLAEPLARMGARVTGVDAAPENIAAAREHSAGQGLPIDYFVGELAALPPAKFDLVTSMEVVEHVTDPAAFIGELAARLAPGGLMILSKPEELTKLLEGAGIEVVDRTGLSPSAAKGFKLGGSEALNYLVAARHAG